MQKMLIFIIAAYEGKKSIKPKIKKLAPAS
jgi:hypothetical protein